MKWKSVKRILIWTLMIGGCVTAFGFVKAEQQRATCWQMEVEVEEIEGVYFIDEARVRTRILNMGDPIIGTPMEALQVNSIQDRLRRMPSVDDATVYPGVDGILKVKVTQRKPIARIFEGGGTSYYIDEKRQMMPLSDQYSARVPAVVIETELEFTESLSEDQQAIVNDIAEVVTYLEKDPLWGAQIEHLALLKNGDFELIPRMGNHKIVLGNSRHLDRKMKKLRAFYDAELQSRNLNIYKRINLKYRDQVIGERYY